MNILIEDCVWNLNIYPLKKITQKDNNYMKGYSILYAVSELIEDITTHLLRQLMFKLLRKINAEDYREVENTTYCWLEWKLTGILKGGEGKVSLLWDFPNAHAGIHSSELCRKLHMTFYFIWIVFICSHYNQKLPSCPYKINSV